MRLRHCFIAALCAVAVAWIWLSQRPASKIEAPASAPFTKEPTPTIAVVPAPAQAKAPDATASTLPSVEVAATRRMYAAHAPLRTPTVANPDSEQNRQILQDMVTKALDRAKQAQPSASTK